MTWNDELVLSDRERLSEKAGKLNAVLPFEEGCSACAGQWKLNLICLILQLNRVLARSQREFDVSEYRAIGAFDDSLAGCCGFIPPNAKKKIAFRKTAFGCFLRDRLPDLI